MKICLGPLEQTILLACLEREQRGTPRNGGPLRRDELPALLWGWQGRDWGWQTDYTWAQIAPQEYRAKQASLTRALQNLYRKHLIDAGGRDDATGLKIYSAPRAAALGIEPAHPLTEAEMTEVHYPKVDLGGLVAPWSYKSTGQKPRKDRNIKAMQLTKLGEVVARLLALNRQPASSDLTRITVEVEPPPPPSPLTEAELEAQRHLLAEAEAVITGRQ